MFLNIILTPAGGSRPSPRHAFAGLRLEQTNCISDRFHEGMETQTSGRESTIENLASFEKQTMSPQGSRAEPMTISPGLMLFSRRRWRPITECGVLVPALQYLSVLRQGVWPSKYITRANQSDGYGALRASRRVLGSTTNSQVRSVKVGIISDKVTKVPVLQLAR